jgi:hypothetical protein
MHRRSVTRRLIPFQVRGTAPRAGLHRQVLERYPGLIDAHFHSLGEVSSWCPAECRDSLADAFQLVLDADAPQRDVRAAYLRAETTLREAFLKRENGMEDRSCNVSDPFTRLMFFQLIGVATYYGMLFGVEGDGSLELKAGLLLKTFLTSEVRKDPNFIAVSLVFEALKRDELRAYRAGELRSEEDRAKARQAVLRQLPFSAQKYVSEMFLYERDLLGKFRFDRRGDAHMLFHMLKADEIGHNEDTTLWLFDPLVEQHGHMHVERYPIKNGRWWKYLVTALDEDHRVLEELPQVAELEEETLISHAFSPSLPLGMQTTKPYRPSFFVKFNEPLCARSDLEIVQELQEKAYTPTFETAVIDRSNMTLFERFFERQD